MDLPFKKSDDKTLRLKKLKIDTIDLDHVMS